jgi:hypothetical protein
MTSKLALSVAGVICLGFAGCSTYQHENQLKNATVRSMSLEDTIKQIRTAINASEPADNEPPMFVYPRTITIELMLTKETKDEQNGKLAVAFPPVSAEVGGGTTRQLTTGNTVTIEFQSLNGISKDTIGWNVWGGKPPCPDHVKTSAQMKKLGCVPQTGVLQTSPPK